MSAKSVLSNIAVAVWVTGLTVSFGALLFWLKFLAPWPFLSSRSDPVDWLLYGVAAWTVVGIGFLLSRPRRPGRATAVVLPGRETPAGERTDAPRWPFPSP